MMILDTSATPVVERFKGANDAEGVAIKTLLAYMQGGGKDMDMLTELTNKMTETHDKKMEIWNELQSLRIDK